MGKDITSVVRTESALELQYFEEDTGGFGLGGLAAGATAHPDRPLPSKWPVVIARKRRRLSTWGCRE